MTLLKFYDAFMTLLKFYDAFMTLFQFTGINDTDRYGSLFTAPDGLCTRMSSGR